MKFLTLAAVGVLGLAGVLVLRPMLDVVPVEAAPAAPVADAVVSALPSQPEPEWPATAAPAPEPVVAPQATRAAAFASAADRGQADVPPAPQTFVGPDGRTHVIGPASPELQAMGDENLRLAVLEEIRSDPEAFALAMNVELMDVQRVAEGKAELPLSWLVR